MPGIEYGSLPFVEQIDFFRAKLNLPTRTWTDIERGMHARAFVVAGAMKTDLLQDLRTAVDKAVTQGTTLQQFRKDFDDIIARRGWAYKGKRDWRTRVIFETNLRTAYQAGRYKQLTDPDTIKSRPYWRYAHSDVVLDPRQQHQAWDNLVLPHDDPFWDTHYPPNGWGCQCTVMAESERSLKRKSLSVGKTPDIKLRTAKFGNQTVRVPQGIDPGWNYNVGEAAWGRPLAQQAMRNYGPGGNWTLLTTGSPVTYGRPENLPVLTTGTKPGRYVTSTDDTVTELTRILGGEEKAFTLTGNNGFTYPINVNAEILGRHLKPDRTPYLPLLPELLEHPQEAWLGFYRHKQTGEIALRMKLIRLIKIQDKDKPVLFVADARRGQLEAWTLIPMRTANQTNKRRRGKLIATSEEKGQ